MVRQNFIYPANDAYGSLAKKWVLRELPAVEIIFQEFRVVVRHFLEVGNEPALVHRVTVETTGKLVVNAASSHFFKGGFGHGKQMLFFRLLVALEEKIDG